MTLGISERHARMVLLTLSILPLLLAGKSSLSATCPGRFDGYPGACYTEPCADDEDETCYKAQCPPCVGPPHGEEAGLCLDSQHYDCGTAKLFFCDQFVC